MSAQLEIVFYQVHGLSFKERVQLIQRITDTLTPKTTEKVGQGLIYGKYRNTGKPLSTEADFRLA